MMVGGFRDSLNGRHGTLMPPPWGYGLNTHKMRKLGEWGAVYYWDDHIICLNGDSYVVSHPYGQDLTWIGNQMGAARKIQTRWWQQLLPSVFLFQMHLNTEIRSGKLAYCTQSQPLTIPPGATLRSASLTSGIVTIFGIPPFWTNWGLMMFNGSRVHITSHEGEKIWVWGWCIRHFAEPKNGTLEAPNPGACCWIGKLGWFKVPGLSIVKALYQLQTVINGLLSFHH